MFEMARSEKDERRVFADIIKDVIEKRGIHRTPKKEKGANFEIDEAKHDPSNIKDTATAAKKTRKNRSELAMAAKDDRNMLSARNNNSTLDNTKNQD